MVDNYYENQMLNKKLENFKTIEGEKTLYAVKLESLLAITDRVLFMKNWWPHRKWLLSNKQDLSTYTEEYKFVDYMLS